MWRTVRALLLISVLLSVWPCEATRRVLEGVPEYPNAPSSGGMIPGYWDRRGYPDLVPGAPEPYRDEIRQFIASERHLADYWVEWGSSAEDPWFTEGRQRPSTADCLADSMGTSVYPRADGWTSFSVVSLGLRNFAEMRGEGYDFAATRHLALDFQSDFVPEIDAGRPVILFVRIGSAMNHVLVGYGYDDTDADDPKFAAMDTYLGNPPGAVDWWSWSKVAEGVTFRPESDPVPYPEGDVNRDWCVNVADLLTVRNNLGATGSAITPPEADIDGDNTVNIADLLTVRNRLGEGVYCP